MDGPAESAWPAVDVIVATYNEEQLIAGKLREFDAIAYPPDRLRVIVVDGGSSDNTIGAIAAHAQRDRRVLPILMPLASKPAQLNEALARSSAPWILVTDADARVPPDTLRRLIETAQRDRTAGVVGTRVTPHAAHPLDRWHWRLSNWIRSAERRASGATGLAVGTCYLFRRDLLDRFPDDAMADDVFIVCHAARQGARTVLVESHVTELRVAATTLGWFRHKVRRTTHYLHEMFRFAPSLFLMAAPMRSLLVWRALALTIAPAAGLVLSLVLAWALGLWFPATVLIAAGASGLMPGAGTTDGVRSRLVVTTLPLWILLITLSALLLYPVTRQTGPYSRRPLKADEPETCS